MQSIAYCKDSAFLFCLHEMSLNRSQCHPRLTLTRAVPSAQPSRYSGTVQLASDEILDLIIRLKIRLMPHVVTPRGHSDGEKVFSLTQGVSWSLMPTVSPRWPRPRHIKRQFFSHSGFSNRLSKKYLIPLNMNLTLHPWSGQRAVRGTAQLSATRVSLSCLSVLWLNIRSKMSFAEFVEVEYF